MHVVYRRVYIDYSVSELLADVNVIFSSFVIQ